MTLYKRKPKNWLHAISLKLFPDIVECLDAKPKIFGDFTWEPTFNFNNIPLWIVKKNNQLLAFDRKVKNEYEQIP